MWQPVVQPLHETLNVGVAGAKNLTNLPGTGSVELTANPIVPPSDRLLININTVSPPVFEGLLGSSSLISCTIRYELVIVL